MVSEARRQRLLSEEHFSVDGTLLKAWTSVKSVRTRDEEGKPAYGAGGRNPWEDFRGERRSNATHVSTTDPEALLALVHLRAPVHQPGVEARRIRRRLAWWRLSVLRVGARTALPPAMPSCHDRGVAGSGEPHSPPSHISKTVPPTVHLGPPHWTKSRTLAPSRVTPSEGIGMVYVRVISSPTTSIPCTNLRMRAFRSGNVPCSRKLRSASKPFSECLGCKEIRDCNRVRSMLKRGLCR